MAIDADLNAGILTSEEAKEKISKRSFMVLWMAKKFVKGDAMQEFILVIK